MWSQCYVTLWQWLPSWLCWWSLGYGRLGYIKVLIRFHVKFPNKDQAFKHLCGKTLVAGESGWKTYICSFSYSFNYSVGLKFFQNIKLKENLWIFISLLWNQDVRTTSQGHTRLNDTLCTKFPAWRWHTQNHAQCFQPCSLGERDAPLSLAPALRVRQDRTQLAQTDVMWMEVTRVALRQDLWECSTPYHVPFPVWAQTEGEAHEPGAWVASWALCQARREQNYLPLTRSH